MPDESDESAALARFDAVAVVLVERARPAILRAATTLDEVAAAQALRGRALLDMGWAGAVDLVDGREVDTDDERATHLLAFLDARPIATCRLIYPEPGRLLPMESRPGAMRVPADAVEVGRVVVAPGLTGTGGTERSLTAALIGRAWLELRAHEHRRICGAVSASVLRLYRRLGFLVRVIGPPVTVFGEERYPILFEPTAAAASFVSDRQAG